MPPAAISRSSTNLPKICGNIALAYRSALTALSLLSCAAEPEPGPDLPVVLHQLEDQGCRLPAPLGDVSVELDALGDFPASNRTTEAFPANANGRSLRFPEGTLAATAIAAAPSGERWWGFGERKDGRIDALLWPEASPCEIASGDAFLVPRGQGLGFSKSAGVVLAVGNDSGDPDISTRGILFDVASGTVEQADMQLPRAFATVSEFGNRLLVAAGRDPTSSSKFYDLLVFDPATRAFETPSTELYRRRAKHAAVVLPSGETLLVGGVGDENGDPLADLEAISPETLRTRVTELDSLSQARSAPYAFVLDDGRIFVGGGEISPGVPASTVEWLSSDASEHANPAPIDLQPRLNRAFVALPGSAVLGVGGCEPVSSSAVPPACDVCCPGEACSACPPASGFDAVWIGPDGLTYPFALDVGVVAARPSLIAASDGAPFLVSDDGRLFRFDPWNQRFDAVALPSEPLPPPGGPRPLALDAGTFVWFAERGASGVLLGMRHDIRNRYSRDVVLLADPLRPLHLSPDRPPGLDSGVAFDGRLELGRASVVVSDTDYGDVSLEIVLHAGPPPIFLLGGTELGGPICPWPASSLPLPENLRLTRSHEQARLIRGERGELVTTCAVPAGRTSIALRGDPSTPSIVSQLVIRRGPSP